MSNLKLLMRKILICITNLCSWLEIARARGERGRKRKLPQMNNSFILDQRGRRAPIGFSFPPHWYDLFRVLVGQVNPCRDATFCCSDESINSFSASVLRRNNPLGSNNVGWALYLSQRTSAFRRYERKIIFLLLIANSETIKREGKVGMEKLAASSEATKISDGSAPIILLTFKSFQIIYFESRGDAAPS